VVSGETNLVDCIVHQMHLGIQDQVDMFSTKDIALAEGRRLIVIRGADGMRQNIEVFGCFGFVWLGESHDVERGKAGEWNNHRDLESTIASWRKIPYRLEIWLIESRNLEVIDYIDA
jgi:hypothetical protein